MTAPGSTAPQFALLPSDRPARDIEEDMLTRWRDEGLFARTLAAREGAPRFVFFEGPPTANGRPGIHHVFSRTVKDLFCRYRAMRGFLVDRKAGWDTHGLPVEIEVEKALGISGKQQIEALGVERFNRMCRESVWRYREDWEKLSERIAFWLDYDHPYVTYSNEYVESVWWALATLHARDLLYRGHKVLPYCPRCGTALSSHEVAQGYEDVEDPSVYVALDLVVPSGVPPRRILVWTTTPWTLVSNTALAVNPDLEYIEVRRRKEDGTYLLAEARAIALLGDDYATQWEVVGRERGRDLAGLQYRRPLDWVPFGEGAHEIIVAEDFVSADDGTGVVHLAPAFGADDYAAFRRHGLAFLQPVNLRGEFAADIPVVGGKFARDANAAVIEVLRGRPPLLWKVENFTHAYPHCWRCGTPLLYYARTSWFIRTTRFRDEMLARNAAVDWHPPELGAGRFGEWLENNIDWAISRDRYWGTPLPVWICEGDATHIDVIGSYDALAERIGRPLPSDFDPHKPFIDQYDWTCSTCAAAGRQSRMRRAPEVIDTWFDSGSMPFAQWHYPFEHRDECARQYPADFIAEGVDQTRGWFYSLLAIATGLGDGLPNNQRPASHEGAWPAPYRSVVVNDLILDAEGQKMSKSRGNTVDPGDVIPRHGADAIRLFLVSASQIWLPRRFDESAIRETAGRFLVTLKNIYSGIFAEYANFGWAPSPLDPAPEQRPPLDRWVLSRLAAVEAEADRLLDTYDAMSAAKRVMEFVDDDVSKWYVRLSRSRFYEVDTEDNRAAFATLHEVLTVVCRLLAPFTPFVSDWMHRELTGESVHLASYTRGEVAHADDELDRAMADVRVLARLGRAAREEAGIRVRQPLGRMIGVVPGVPSSALAALVPLLAAELNVKSIEFAQGAESLVTLSAKPNYRVLGKRFGSRTPQAAAVISTLSSEALLAFTHGGALTVVVDGETFELAADEVTISRQSAGELVVSGDAGYLVAVDPAVTPALRREGLVREVLSRVQRLRKESALAVSDRITLWVAGTPELEEAVNEYRDRIAAETLAVRVLVGDPGLAAHDAVRAEDIDGSPVRIAITRER